MILENPNKLSEEGIRKAKTEIVKTSNSSLDQEMNFDGSGLDDVSLECP